MALQKKSLSRFHEYLERSNMKKNQHQEEGIWWCIQRELQLESFAVDDKEVFIDISKFQIAKGGIIADEMGLGKTILMLGLIVSNFVRNTLIVLPLPLLTQWKNEIKRTLGHDVLVYHGSNIKNTTKEQLKDAAIVLTTYGALKPRNKENLYAVKWNRIIYDEAHHMRNSSSKKYFYGKLLKSDSKWLLTGTPVQNKVGDLHSLFSILGYSHKETINYELFKELRKHHILRRLKKDVGINLPKVHYHNVNVKWKNELEKKVSENIHNLVQSNYSSENIAWLESIGEQKIIQMVRAKQICVCPKLLETKIKHMINQGKLSEDYNILLTSKSKLDSVVEKLKKRKNNKNKKIVFCSFHEEMNILKDMLYKNNMKSVGIYSGRLNIRARQKVIDKNYDILLMQIQAGSEGLNLQQYNEIYFVSPHWNPCVEDQAIGRSYRMGQKKETYIFHFNMNEINIKNKVNSMDNYVKNVQKDKRLLQEELL